MKTRLKVYEVLVPTLYGDTGKPISTAHHKEWDKQVQKLTGGLTICAIAKGKWTNTQTEEEWIERTIPVRIACDESRIWQIVDITLSHYRQQAVMFYKISDMVEIKYAKANV